MKYPPELRFMVYKVVANDEANTRIIEVIPTVLKYPPTSINAWSFEVAILQLPLMILVNREITEELLRSCFIAPFSSQTFRLGTNTLALDLRFNPENDVLFLNANCYVSMQMREFLPLQSLFEDCTEKLPETLLPLYGTPRRKFMRNCSKISDVSTESICLNLI